MIILQIIDEFVRKKKKRQEMLSQRAKESAWMKASGKRVWGSVGCPNRMRARTGSLIL